ncbi:hypothetical protein ABIE65_000617 [Constrictibacter sp. MBR-5]
MLPKGPMRDVGRGEGMIRGRLAALALASALLAGTVPAMAQDALVVECREGAVMLENWYDPDTAVGDAGDKVLPLHMLLRTPGSYTFEFQSEQPFAVYAYRYDPARRDWAFLPESATAHANADPDLPWAWSGTVRKTTGRPEDYLLQAAPQGAAQGERHRFLHIRRIDSCR